MRLANLAYGELITAGGYTLAYLSGQPAIVAILACFGVVDRADARARARRVPAAARHLARDDARRDVRDQLPAAEHLPARVRLARRGRRHARRAQHGGLDRLAADPLDLDRRARRRRAAPGRHDPAPQPHDDRPAHPRRRGRLPHGAHRRRPREPRDRLLVRDLGLPRRGGGGAPHRAVAARHARLRRAR